MLGEPQDRLRTWSGQILTWAFEKFHVVQSRPLHSHPFLVLLFQWDTSKSWLGGGIQGPEVGSEPRPGLHILPLLSRSLFKRLWFMQEAIITVSLGSFLLQKNYSSSLGQMKALPWPWQRTGQHRIMGARLQHQPPQPVPRTEL